MLFHLAFSSVVKYEHPFSFLKGNKENIAIIRHLTYHFNVGMEVKEIRKIFLNNREWRGYTGVESEKTFTVRKHAFHMHAAYVPLFVK